MQLDGKTRLLSCPDRSLVTTLTELPRLPSFKRHRLSTVQNALTNFFSKYSIVICYEAMVSARRDGEQSSTLHPSLCTFRYMFSQSPHSGQALHMDRNVSSLHNATEATLTARVCHLAACRRPTAVSTGFGKYLRCLTAKFESPCGVRVQNSSEQFRTVLNSSEHKHNGM